MHGIPPSARLRLHRRYGGCLIQEYIPGGADALHTVTVVCSGTGRLAGGFTARKIRHWPSLGGVTACGVSTREELLVDGVLPFFARVRWRGPAEVELKRGPMRRARGPCSAACCPTRCRFSPARSWRRGPPPAAFARASAQDDPPQRVGS
jgi:hypothetical protein